MMRLMYEPKTSKPVYTKMVRIGVCVHSLHYDASNMAYVEGDIAPGEDAHAVHQVFDICEDGNIDRVNRVISLAVRECGEFLFPYSKEIVENEAEADNAGDEACSYVFVLAVPNDFPQISIDTLKEQIHEYVVCRVLSDWLSITNLTNVKSAEVWAQKGEAAKDAILRTLRTRSRRVRRTITPF